MKPSARRAGPLLAALLTAVAAANVGVALAAQAYTHTAGGDAAGMGGLQGALQVIKLEDGTTIQAEEFMGPSKASALPYLFYTAVVDVQCAPNLKDYSVYVGPTMAEVRAAYERGDRAWCGVGHLMRESPNCTVSIPPVGTTWVAVAKPRGSWLAGGESHACQMHRRAGLSMPRLVTAVLGAWLFWAAPVLSESTPFRLTGGTLGFMALSSVVVLFILYRKVPHKGKLLAGAAVFGSSFLASVRWLFGVWLPSAYQVLHHPVTLTYLALSGLTGLAVTYYYNNTENRKVNTMLRVALQMVGLASVYLSSSLTEGSLALCLALLAAKAWTFLHQHRSMREALASAKRNVQQQLGASADGEQQQQGAAGEPASAAAAARAGSGRQQQAQQQQQQLRTPVVGGVADARGVVAEVSPLIQRGLVLNEETGHIIGIGKATYNRLVDSGYVVDRYAGTITPPPPSPDSPARPGRGSARARRRRTP